MLILVSRNNNEIKPKSIAALAAKPKEPALGKRHMTKIATLAPINK